MEDVIRTYNAVELEDKFDDSAGSAVIVSDDLILIRYPIEILLEDVYAEIHNVLDEESFWILCSEQRDEHTYIALNMRSGYFIEDAPRHFITGKEYLVPFETFEEWQSYLGSIDTANIELHDLKVNDLTISVTVLFIDCTIEDMPVLYNRVFHDGDLESVNMINSMWAITKRIPRYNARWESPVEIKLISGDDEAISKTYLVYNEHETIAYIEMAGQAKFIERLKALLEYMIGTPTETIESMNDMTFLEFVELTRVLHTLAGPYIDQG